MVIFQPTFYGQVMAKKNAKQIGINPRTGRPFLRQSDAAKLQEREMIRTFSTDYMLQGMKSESFEGKPLEVQVRIWNKDAKKHDLDNQLATIMDALVKARCIPDDNQETVRKESIEYCGIDREDPRAEITIYSF